MEGQIVCFGVWLFNDSFELTDMRFVPPCRGIRGRSVWYFAHWILGTGVSILGIINIYTGLYVYHTKTSRSVRFWSYFFSAEVAIIAFLYLLQDRWEYMQKQGVILGEEPIAPTDHVTLPRPNQKEWRVPCGKAME